MAVNEITPAGPGAEAFARRLLKTTIAGARPLHFRPRDVDPLLRQIFAVSTAMEAAMSDAAAPTRAILQGCTEAIATLAFIATISNQGARHDWVRSSYAIASRRAVVGVRTV
ncbi:hypothetical protein GVO57_09375 [Sphingomonas changnyeongensis]|uniref:Uncharacterized protein n=1 Tax=Sphingomonas changnyeongensis TaxID=2698679 RepID=A0A7Z2NWU9_9SPHN|nr:hypothetical protein [Sphingomonas changnyeongensis]QHL90992.1 hypothetical protein GVO57_09375 [Sphingomonas changnyeongensis]